MNVVDQLKPMSLWLTMWKGGGDEVGEATISSRNLPLSPHTKIAYPRHTFSPLSF